MKLKGMQDNMKENKSPMILMKYLMSIVNHCVSMMNLLTKKEIATLQH